MCNSMTFALRHTQISLSGILRHFRPPSRHLLLHTHDTNMEFLQLSGPLINGFFFWFFSKTKIFHSHPCKYKNTKHMHIRHPKQHVSRQSCSNIQQSRKEGFKKKKKRRHTHKAQAWLQSYQKYPDLFFSSFSVDPDLIWNTVDQFGYVETHS